MFLVEKALDDQDINFYVFSQCVQHCFWMTQQLGSSGHHAHFSTQFSQFMIVLFCLVKAQCS